MQRDGLQHVGAEFFPGLGFREDGVAERPRAVTALLRVTDFEDQLHASRIRGAAPLTPAAARTVPAESRSARSPAEPKYRAARSRSAPTRIAPTKPSAA